MYADIVLPKIGMAMQDGTITRWYKQVGDEVKQGEPLIEVETEKVSVDIEAPDEGILSEILAQPGETIDVGTVIGRIQVE